MSGVWLKTRPPLKNFPIEIREQRKQKTMLNIKTTATLFTLGFSGLLLAGCADEPTAVSIQAPLVHSMSEAAQRCGEDGVHQVKLKEKGTFTSSWVFVRCSEVQGS